jgi:hypothetical protein
VDFFISHAGRDRAWAEWVAWQLVEAGYKVELDTWDWAAGDNFVNKMAAAMDRADRVIALFSRAYFEPQRYTTDEWTAALVKDDANRARLLPLRVEECEIPRLLRPLITHAVFGLDEEQARAQLLDAARGPRRPDGKPVFPPTQEVAHAHAGPRPRIPGLQPPVWNVPQRNADFCGRDGAFASLRERLLSGGADAVQVLYGMGGVGKTQLAIEYAHRFAGDYELVWWIAAEQASLVSEQFAALAVAAGLTATNTDHKAADLAVRKHLREQARWLLIFDNAEDPDALRPWLSIGSGHIVITSRNPGWNEVAARREVDVFTRPESFALLRTRLPNLGDVDANRLTEALGGLPLALAQASGTLAETGLSASEYLELLAKRTTEVLDENRPMSYPTSLAAAVRLSTEQLADKEPAAVELLQLCAVLTPERIPTSLLNASNVLTDGPLAAVAGDPLTLGRMLRLIGRYGLARITDGIHLHRLVRAVLRDQLTPTDLQKFHFQAEELLAAAHPGSSDDPTTWPRWAELLPHLMELDPATSGNERLRLMANGAALYLLRRGDTRSALPFVRRLYEQWRERIGPDDRNTLTAATELAHTYHLLGYDRRARVLIEDTLPRWRREFGPDDAGTLRSGSDLGVVVSSLGEYGRALSLDEEVLERRRRTLGEEHPDTLRSMENVACISRRLGQIERARSLHEETLERRRRVLGEEHPDTLSSMLNLCTLLQRIGEHGRAYQLIEAVIEKSRRVLGEDHPGTLDAMARWADSLSNLKEVDRALSMQEEILESRRRILGEDHPKTLSSMVDLAVSCHNLRTFVRARRLMEDALHTQMRVLGEDHPDTLSSQQTLGSMLLRSKNPMQARVLLATTLAKQRSSFGNDYEETLRTATWLALALHQIGAKARARHVAEDTIMRYRRVFGEDSYVVRNVSLQLAQVLRSQPKKSKRR